MKKILFIRFQFHSCYAITAHGERESGEGWQGVNNRFVVVTVAVTVASALRLVYICILHIEYASVVAQGRVRARAGYRHIHRKKINNFF